MAPVAADIEDIPFDGVRHVVFRGQQVKQVRAGTEVVWPDPWQDTWFDEYLGKE